MASFIAGPSRLGVTHRVRSCIHHHIRTTQWTIEHSARFQTCATRSARPRAKGKANPQTQVETGAQTQVETGAQTKVETGAQTKARTRVEPKSEVTAPYSTTDHVLPESKDTGTSQFHNTEFSPVDVGILGGGITGLATAYYLTKMLPMARITIYEAKPNMGGWISSRQVEVDDGTVLFEAGPRTLRPVGLGFLAQNLVHELGLEKETIFTSKTSPAALYRYLYYPDRLVVMPSPGLGVFGIMRSLFTEPVFQGVPRHLLKSIFKWLTGQDAPRQRRMSVGEYFAHLIGPQAVDRTLSAMMHGIYAGDVWRLEMGALFPRLWDNVNHHKSLFGGLLMTVAGRHSETVALSDKSDAATRDSLPVPKELTKKFQDCSVFTFRRGLGQLHESLLEYLSQHSVPVRFRSNTHVLRCRAVCDDIEVLYDQGGKDGSRKHMHTHVVSALGPTHLWATLGYPKSVRDPSFVRDHPPLTQSEARELSSSMKRDDGMHSVRPPRVELESVCGPLSSIESVSVMTVNMYYRSSSLHPDGFGYLIPNATPLEQNPEMALGVIFDNSYSPGPQDEAGGGPVQDTVSVRGTKLTVMLGGHYWSSFATSDLPSSEDGIRMAKSLLKRHLGITEEPLVVSANLQVNCIPQFTAEHASNVSMIKKELEAGFGGRLHCAGSWLHGVGVNDCLRSAHDAANEIVKSLRVSCRVTE